MSRTPRENVLAIIDGETPYRVPFLIWDNKIPDPATARRLIELEACIIVKSAVYDVKLRSVAKQEAVWEEDGHRFLRTTYQTPHGDLTDVSLVSSGSLWHQKPVFESPDDYERLFALVSNFHYVPTFDRFLADDSRHGASSIARPATEKSPLFEILYDYLGVAAFAVEWEERRELIIRLFDLLLEKRRERLEIVRHSPARFVIVDGNIEMSVVGHERFDRFYAPVIREAAELLQAAGKRTGLHLDGRNRPLAGPVSLLPIDLIESFTPPPDCDLSLPEALDVWPGKRFMVNIPSSVHLAGGPAVQAMTASLAEQARASGRAAIGIMEDVPVTDYLCLTALTVNEASAGKGARTRENRSSKMDSPARPDTRQQLVYYIAPAAPPTRTPAVGNEAFMRPEVGFNPSWFNLHCGVDFSERWHADPDYRLQCHEVMTRELRRRFPGRAIAGANLDESPDLLTGIYAGAVVAALYGQCILYFDDKWPVAHGAPLSDEQAIALTPVDLPDAPLLEGILRQMDRIEQLTGTIRGFLNWQGPLNTAFRLRGQQIFIDLIENPSLAEHLFECIAETMVIGMKLLYRRQLEAGQDYNFASVSNCVVNMVSPEMYRERLLPFDAWIRSQFPVFGIHNCAWRVDPYLESYREVPSLGYLDMGLDSDLDKARRLFPEARRNVLLTSMYLASRSDAEIRVDLERIARDLGPCDVGLPDIEIDVPDHRILYVLDLCQELSERYAPATQTGGC